MASYFYDNFIVSGITESFPNCSTIRIVSTGLNDLNDEIDVTFSVSGNSPNNTYASSVNKSLKHNTDAVFEITLYDANDVVIGTGTTTATFT